MPYLFVSHRSACEALRHMGTAFPTWPAEPRFLPTHGDCIAHQRAFALFARKANIEELGMVSRPVDILVPSSLMRRKGKQARMHGWRNQLPAGCFLRMREDVLVSTPAFTLLQLANVHVRKSPALDAAVDRHLEERDALRSLGIDAAAPIHDLYAWQKVATSIRLAVLAMEFMGTYRLGTRQGEKTRYGCARLTSVDEVRAFCLGFPPSHGHKHTGSQKMLLHVLAWVMEGSASPMETALALMLTLPAELGGYGLPKPTLNMPLDEGDP